MRLMWRGLSRWLGRKRFKSHCKLDLPLGELSPELNTLALPARIAAPVVVASAELLRRRGRFFVRLRSIDGVEGVAVGSDRLHYLLPIVTQRVLPLFVGQDLRHIERLVDEIGRHDGNYKLAGLAFWSCVAGAEIAAFDLLGKTAGLSVAELLNPAGSRHVLRREIPVYLSSLRRETTPKEEVARLAARLSETGATAIKVKIGGRMGRDDATPGRTPRLIELARTALGDHVTIHADANGSYGVKRAIEVGGMLEDHGVYLFEEPCAWEGFEATKAVADALERVLVAGGEQDASLEKFRWMIANRGVDVVQPDVVSNGGFVRTLRVARLTAAAGMDVSYHSARADFAARTCCISRRRRRTWGGFRNSWRTLPRMGARTNGLNRRGASPIWRFEVALWRCRRRVDWGS
jgi:L-alanine-DL-glutamate epimerase-like enolase superfamily enzyme